MPLASRAAGACSRVVFVGRGETIGVLAQGDWGHGGRVWWRGEDSRVRFLCVPGPEMRPDLPPRLSAQVVRVDGQ